MLTVMVALALVSEPLSCCPLDLDANSGALWQFVNLFFDILGLHARQKTRSQGIDQLICCTCDSSGLFAHIRQQSEEEGVQHPVEAGLLLLDLLVVFLQALLLELELAHLHFFLEVHVLDGFLIDDAADACIYCSQQVCLEFGSEFGVILEDLVPGGLRQFDQLLIFLMCKIWNDLQVEAVSGILLVELLEVDAW